MTPLLISVLAFAGVATLIGLVAYVFNDNASKTGERLDTLTGKRKKEDEATTILKKTAFDRDKNSLLEMLTPNILSLQKIMTQADCHIKPSTLFAIGVVLGVMGATLSWM